MPALKRGRHARADAVDDQVGGPDVGVDQREHELVAADAAADVAGAQLVAHRGRDGAQRLVADRVPGGVDRLEVVEVERHDRHRVPAALGTAQLLGEALLEGAVVEEAGERVLERLEQRVGHAVEVAREGADLVATAEVGAGGAVAVAQAVGDRADVVEAADDGAAEQQADEAAEDQRGGDAQQREDPAVPGAGVVERGEVVVQLEQGVGADRVADLGLVPARLAAGFGHLRAAAGVVPRHGDLGEVRVEVVQTLHPLLHQLRVGQLAGVEPVLPRRRDRGQLGAGGALVGVVDRARRCADHHRREHEDAAEDEGGDAGTEAGERVQAAHFVLFRPNGCRN